jgi:hypothetical protein
VADRSAELTPTQERVCAELLDLGGARPEFDRQLAVRLRNELESKARSALSRSGVGDPPGPGPARPLLTVSKRTLAFIHQCERLLMTDQREPFAWTAATACGTVAHKAIELGIHSDEHLPPARLVAFAIDRIIDDDQGPAQWLLTASEGERAELRSAAVDAVTKFGDSFPPIRIGWRPRVESRLRLSLADGRIELSGRVDLALGQAKPTANGSEARTMIIDLKTGRPGVHHAADLRFYALLETVRVGVPPFRLASFYLDAGEWRCEDVDEDLLWAAARRTTDGIERLVLLQLAGHEPTETPGAQCGWCPAQAECPTGMAWLAEQPHSGRRFADPSAAAPDRHPSPP